MAVDKSKFPEIKTFSSVIRYSLSLEEEMENFYREGAREKSGMEELADAHKKRYQLLEETRQQKLNEMILEPISGIDREAYIPELEATGGSDLISVAIKAEELSRDFYNDLTETAKELSREASKVYKKMAKENGKLINKLKEM
jgi:hypothetical protein